MGCGGSSATSGSDAKFENGKPSFQGDEIVKGFEQGNGLLFRIVNTKKKQWAFYNDTKEYEMHVRVTFNEGCEIVALGKAKLEQIEDGKWVGSLVVAPLATEMFIQGHVDGFESKMDAIPVDEAA